jgi:hypothetical protein
MAGNKKFAAGSASGSGSGSGEAAVASIPKGKASSSSDAKVKGGVKKAAKTGGKGATKGEKKQPTRIAKRDFVDEAGNQVTVTIQFKRPDGRVLNAIRASDDRTATTALGRIFDMDHGVTLSTSPVAGAEGATEAHHVKGSIFPYNLVPEVLPAGAKPVLYVVGATKAKVTVAK